MTKEENKLLAYAEVHWILEHLEEDYRKRIPEELITFFKEERDKEYVPQIDINIPLEEQNLNRSTYIILAILNMKYLCDSEEEKQKILKEWEENEIEAKENLIGLESLEEVFNKKTQIKEEIEKANTYLAPYEKSNIFKKILARIQNMFKKKN